jgi:hypothetical protein
LKLDVRNGAIIIVIFYLSVGDIPFHTFSQICNIELRFPDNLISESAKVGFTNLLVQARESLVT